MRAQKANIIVRRRIKNRDYYCSRMNQTVSERVPREYLRLVN